MRVRAWIETEADVYVSAEQILAELPGESGEASTMQQVQSLLSRCHGCLKAVPDSLIKQLTPEARRVIADALRLQAERYQEE